MVQCDFCTRTVAVVMSLTMSQQLRSHFNNWGSIETFHGFPKPVHQLMLHNNKDNVT